MFDLYTWTTPNSRKVIVMLEECGIPYNVHPLNIRKMPDVVGEGANVTRWINAIGARPAVQKGMAGPQI